MAVGADSRTIAARVARNTVSNLLGKLVFLALGFLITPFVLRQLGVATYGIWVLSGSVAGYGGLLELGISGAVIKYVAEHQARREIEKADEVVAAALWLYCGLGLAAFALVMASAPLLPRLFHLTADQHQTMTELVYLIGAAIALSIPCTITTAILRGLQRYDLVSALSVFGGIASVTLTVAVLLCGGGVVGLAWVALAMVPLVQLPSIWLIRRICPQLHIRLRRPRRDLVRSVLSFSSPLLVLNVASTLQSRTNDVIVGGFLPLTLMTPFAIARKLSVVPQIVADQFTKVLMPLASELHAASAETHLRAVYLVGTRLALAILMPVGSVLVMLAGPILVCWIGPAFEPYAVLTGILTAAIVVDSSQWPAGLVLEGMARHRILAHIAICEGVANAIISVALVSRLGLAGVALGMLVPKIGAFLFLFVYTLRVIGISRAQALQQAFLPAIIPAIPTLVVLYAARPMLHPGSWTATALLSMVAIAVYCIVYLGVGAGRLERELARSLLNAVRIRWQSFAPREEETHSQL